MKETTAEKDPKAAAKLRALISDIGVAMITTVRPDGALRSRPMLTQQAREEGELWFFTSDESELAHDLAEERAVNVSYADPERDRYVSVSGQATLDRNRERLQKLWDPVLKHYFPQGLADPHLALLCVRIEVAEYWDIKSSKMVSLDRGMEPSGADVGNGADASRSDGDSPGAELSEHTKVAIRATPTSG